MLYLSLLNFAKASFLEVNDDMENGNYLTGFREHHNTQNSLLKMIESWKTRLNHGSTVVVMIMDLAKVFDGPKCALLLVNLKV